MAILTDAPLIIEPRLAAADSLDDVPFAAISGLLEEPDRLQALGQRHSD